MLVPPAEGAHGSSARLAHFANFLFQSSKARRDPWRELRLGSREEVADGQFHQHVMARICSYGK